MQSKASLIILKKGRVKILLQKVFIKNYILILLQGTIILQIQVEKKAKHVMKKDHSQK